MTLRHLTFRSARSAACLGAFGALGALFAAPASAEFAVAISPPRFELEARPGEVLRQTMEITNASTRAGTFRLKTADWTYAPDGTVSFVETLAEGSCRPWVAIERRELTVTPGRPYRYRFEITPPKDAPPAECRFAILIEGQDESLNAGGVSVPFNARMAVIVYAAVAGAKPKLELVGPVVQTVDGRQLPALQIRNAGKAHGRLGGFLSGTDAAGTSLEFTPSTSPVLSGETRVIPLVPSRPGEPDVVYTPRMPVTVKGKIEWGKGESQAVDLRFGQ